MIVLVGASASGKTELAKILFNKYGYKKCITTTTRKPRNNEINDVDYHFLTKDAFLKLKNDDKFLEVSLYDHHYYGMQIKDVMYKGVVVVDPNGANAISQKICDQAFIVYVETKKEIRIKRMELRGDQIDKINRRVRNDEDVFVQSRLKQIDLVINNDEQDLNILAALIHKKYEEKYNV